MTFETAEISNQEGMPIALYEFSRNVSGGITYWRYTGADRDIVFDGSTWRAAVAADVGTYDIYTAIPISDEGVTQSAERAQDDFTITMPATAEVPMLYRTYPPSDPVSVTAKIAHYGESGSRVSWIGSVSSVRRRSTIEASVVCNTQIASLGRGGLRLTWARQCQHLLYDGQCRLDKETVKVTGTVAAVTGYALTVAAAASSAVGHFTGGFVEWETADGAIERRGITNHSGASLTILGNTGDLDAGYDVAIYPGCDRTRTRCNFFGNLSNYGGFPHQPGKSPFDGDPVF